MSKLDELIAELCPDGVEYRPLGEMCYLVTKQTGFDYTNHIKDRLLTEKADGAIPYMQTKFFSGHSFNYDTDYYVPEDIVERFPKITLNERCLLFSIVGASIGNVGLFPAEQKCFLGGAICVAKVKPEHNIDFLYYCVESHDFQRQIVKKTKGPQATITVDDIRKFKVPVPPLEVQCEIVRVLDNFTFLSAELSAELSARRKQLSYYVDRIVDKDIRLKSSEGIVFPDWQYLKVTEMVKDTKGSIKIGPFGSALKKDDFVKEGIVVYEQDNVFKDDFYSSRYYITHEKYEALKNCTLEPEDIVISMMGTVGQCAVFPKNAPKGIMNSHLLRLQLLPEIDPEFVCYMIRYNHNIRRQIDAMSVGSIMSGLSASIVKRLEFPIPCFEEQREIVRFLDRFVRINNSLTEGIPAEIEARQKQYEYYRDKLLTFKEKA